MAELWRVVAPGGLAALTDTDWGTFAVDLPEPSAAGALASAALGWVPHPRLATTLAAMLAELGAVGLDTRSDEVEVVAWDPDDPAQADGPPGLPLHSIAHGAAVADRPAALEAVAALADAARAGRFAARLTILTVVGRR